MNIWVDCIMVWKQILTQANLLSRTPIVRRTTSYFNSWRVLRKCVEIRPVGCLTGFFVLVCYGTPSRLVGARFRVTTTFVVT
jgi:hypothetical protein